jgi:hypothetical protein
MLANRGIGSEMAMERRWSVADLQSSSGIDRPESDWLFHLETHKSSMEIRAFHPFDVSARLRRRAPTTRAAAAAAPSSGSDSGSGTSLTGKLPSNRMSWRL